MMATWDDSESFEDESDSEEDESEESVEDAEAVAEAESSEEAPKPKKRRSKKVTPPEELESRTEETECESQEFNDNQAENEVACEHTEG